MRRLYKLMDLNRIVISALGNIHLCKIRLFIVQNVNKECINIVQTLMKYQKMIFIASVVRLRTRIKFVIFVKEKIWVCSIVPFSQTILFVRSLEPWFKERIEFVRFVNRLVLKRLDVFLVKDLYIRYVLISMDSI